MPKLVPTLLLTFLPLLAAPGCDDGGDDNPSTTDVAVTDGSTSTTGVATDATSGSETGTGETGDVEHEVPDPYGACVGTDPTACEIAGSECRDGTCVPACEVDVPCPPAISEGYETVCRMGCVIKCNAGVCPTGMECYGNYVCVWPADGGTTDGDTD